MTQSWHVKAFCEDSEGKWIHNFIVQADSMNTAITMAKEFDKSMRYCLFVATPVESIVYDVGFHCYDYS